MGPKKGNRKQDEQLKDNDQNKHKKIAKTDKKTSKKPSNSQDASYSGDQTPNKRGSRKKSGVNLGRPKQTGPIEVKQDPTATIQQKFLQYLDSIGLKHGLVFRPEQRRKLSQQKKLPVIWKMDHEWNEQTERNKILGNPDVVQTIRAHINKRLQGREESEEKKKQKFQLYISAYLNIGDIAAEECTGQIYQIVTEALKSLTNSEDEEQIAERSEKLFHKLHFFSGRFTNIREKYWIEILKDKEKIHDNFVSTFANLVAQVGTLFEQEDKLREFFDEQQMMNNSLKEIKGKLQANKNQK